MKLYLISMKQFAKRKNVLLKLPEDEIDSSTTQANVQIYDDFFLFTVDGRHTNHI